MIYLDNAATTFPKPKTVYREVQSCMKKYGANPGRAGHQLSLKAGRAVYRVRELVSELFHIDNPMQVIFTSNATDSLNLGLKGILKPGDHVITTSMEHNSVMRPLKVLELSGVENTVIKCNREGMIDCDNIKKAIRKNTKLIVSTHASNVTGTLMPIEQIGKIAKEYNIIFLVDAAQTAGVYDIDVKKAYIDLLAIPGHKGLMGPQGVGILYIGEDIKLIPIKEGGTGSNSELLIQPEILPDRYESGTPNTPGIVGLGAGIEFILKKGLNKIQEHEQNLTKLMINELKNIEKVKIYGPKDFQKQAAVLSINIDNKDSTEISYILDKDFNIAVRSGLHCSPMAHKTIGTFEQGTVRFSFSYLTKEKDVYKAIKALKQICSKI